MIVKLKGTVEYFDAEILSAKNVSTTVDQTTQERVGVQGDAETFSTHITMVNPKTQETVRSQKGHSSEMKVRVIGAVFSVMLFLCGVAIIVLHYRPLTF